MSDPTRQDEAKALAHALAAILAALARETAPRRQGPAQAPEAVTA